MNIFQKTSAIVLGSAPHRENTVIFSLFTEQFGFLRALAYGAGFFGSSRSAHLGPGNICEIELSKRNSWTVESCASLMPLKQARKSFETSYLVLHSLALLRDFLPVEMPQPALFRFCAEFLEILETTPTQKIPSLPVGPFIFFQWKTLNLLGLIPKFSENLCHLPEKNRTYGIIEDPFSLQCDVCAKRPLPYPYSLLAMLIGFEKKSTKKCLLESKVPMSEKAMEFLSRFTERKV